MFTYDQVCLSLTLFVLSFPIYPNSIFKNLKIQLKTKKKKTFTPISHPILKSIFFPKLNKFIIREISIVKCSQLKNDSIYGSINKVIFRLYDKRNKFASSMSFFLPNNHPIILQPVISIVAKFVQSLCRYLIFFLSLSI